MSIAEQKLRETVSNSQHRFQHEGSHVVRLLSGGTLPDIYVTFHQRDNMIEVRCSICKVPLGSFSSHYGGCTVQQLAAIRQSGHQH